MKEVINTDINYGDQIQIVSFKLGNEEFGIDIAKVKEINKLSNISKVPNAPRFVEGIVNLRGMIVPLVGLRTKLNLPRKEYDNKTRIVIVEFEGKSIGLIVDEVNEVLRIDNSVLEDPASMSKDIKNEYIDSFIKLGEKILILLNLQPILNDKDEIYSSVN